MNEHSGTFEAKIVEDVRTLARDSKTDVDLFNAMGGVHPIEIKRALLAAKEYKLLESVFSDLAVNGPALREMKRDDNPVLSFWPFTLDCARKLAKISEAYNKVALLGAPTVFSTLRGLQKENVILFDSDDYLFREQSTEGYVQCNLLSDELLSFEDQFDLVVGDPPWYLEDYTAWLDAAIRLARPGGTIIFVLYPQNIRENARREIEEIHRRANGILSNFKSLSLVAEYETPSFEQIELIQNGIRPVDWRRAEFFSAKVPLQKVRAPIRDLPKQVEQWTECRIGCGRLFIQDVASDGFTFLQTANPNSRFLSSPSRRDPSRKKANVVSSRGHGLSCSQPRQFIDLVNEINASSDIERISAQLDKSSSELLQLVANDLWGRFITI